MSKPVHRRDIETDVPIDSTGEVYETTVKLSKLVSVNIDATAEADYALDVSPNKDIYFNAEAEYLSSTMDTTDVRDTFDVTDRYLRIRVTSAATAGATATIAVQGVR
jgi:hypothetical protein